MADRRIPDDSVVPHRDDSPTSTTAIISYALIGVFFVVTVFTYAIVFFRLTVDANLLTTLGSIITASTAALAAVGGFWLASSIGSRMESKASNAAMRQLAGAGAPPPADPQTGVLPVETKP